jgi:mRNA interferase YafQ
MMMTTKYEIHPSQKYLKQVRRLKKRGYNINLLQDVVQLLANGAKLPRNYLDHPLKGDKSGIRDCHIKDDWILLYKIDKGKLVLLLVETGTHADLLD